MYGWTKNKVDSFNLGAVEICDKFGADLIAGPVLSGAVMASSIAATSSALGQSLQAAFLPKSNGLYQPQKHTGGIRMSFGPAIVNRIVLVDDIIESGSSIVAAGREIFRNWQAAEVVAIVCGLFKDWPESAQVINFFPNAHIYAFSVEYKFYRIKQ